MNEPSIFDAETVLPDEHLTPREATLLGFERRYAQVANQLRLLLSAGELDAWNKRFHAGRLALSELVANQYPLVLFHGDVGTGKTVTAECMANRIVRESRTEDSVLFKLSTRVRGSGKVGEMGTLLAEAFRTVTESAGKGRRAVLVIDEGDSLAAARSQEHSHHEDKVAVNTLIQGIDGLRRFQGRVVTFLCTNRLGAIDPALQRRAAIVQEFQRPTADERRQLFAMDLAALKLDPNQVMALVDATGSREIGPPWTFSDIRTRLYPAAIARAFPDSSLRIDHLLAAAAELKPSPVLEDR
ncbi:MAG: AAA family ATPase [Dehalococcoidia bacterium]|nr:AAA family ATPase [Dehalococcoidia bacterium]